MRTGIINKVTKTLNASPESVWNILKNGTDVDKWFPFIKTCRLEGEGIGAKRVCTTEDDKSLEESITNIDHQNMTFVYEIVKHTMEMPTKNIVGVMTITNENEKANLNWEVSFDLTMDLDQSTVDEMKNGMIAIMHTGFDGLEKLAK